jgi:RimJ/RimL family protein N-acetyltransferase
MKTYLVGPDTQEQVLARHKRFLELPEKGTGQIFRIVLLPELEAADRAGYWERVWQEDTVYEMGWSVPTPFQRRGIARSPRSRPAIASARAERTHRYIHVFPSVANAGSNAVWRKLGFIRLVEIGFEYPPGSSMRCNDWRLDLTTPPAAP